MQIAVCETQEECNVKQDLLPWQKAGCSQTATGYGMKLTSSYKVQLPGEKIWRRVYITQYSNAGSSWVLVKGKKVYLY